MAARHGGQESQAPACKGRPCGEEFPSEGHCAENENKVTERGGAQGPPGRGRGGGHEPGGLTRKTRPEGEGDRWLDVPNNLLRCPHFARPPHPTPPHPTPPRAEGACPLQHPTPFVAEWGSFWVEALEGGGGSGSRGAYRGRADVCPPEGLLSPPQRDFCTAPSTLRPRSCRAPCPP